MSRIEQHPSADTSANRIGGQGSVRLDPVEIVSNFAIHLSEITNIDELFQYVLESVARELGYLDCVVYVLDTDREVLRLVESTAEAIPFLQRITETLEVPLELGIVGSVAQSGIAECVHDVTSDPRYIRGVETPGSEICIPLMVDGAVYGVIDCEDPCKDRFTESDRKILTAIASQASAKLTILLQARQMQKTEQTHSNIIANLTDTFCRTDNEGKIVMVSPSAVTLFGYSMEELIGKPFNDLNYDQDQRSRFLEALHQNGGSVTAFEIQLRHKDGGKIWCANSSNFYYDDNGAILGVEGITRNISEKKQDELELARTQHQFIKAQKLALLGSWEYDILNNHMSWSQQIYHILGMDPSLGMIRNRDFLAAVHPEDRDLVDQTHNIARRDSIPFSITFRLYLSDGSMRWFYEECETDRDENGDPARLFGIIHDITERKELEHRLQTSLDEAEAANKVKSDFLATMSHELRTPLNAILGFAEVISGEYFGSVSEARYRDYADDILNSGRYLLELINDLLDLSKVEAGAYEMQRSAFNLPELVESCLSVMRQKALESNVALELEISTDTPPLYGDIRALKQILLNLLSNAMKFTPKDGVITVGCTMDGKDHLIFVRDTGDGIDPDILPHLGEPFRTATRGPYQAEDSTGLGLSITKALIELHGGSLDIDSTLGKGTTVSFRIPHQNITAPD